MTSTGKGILGGFLIVVFTLATVFLGVWRDLGIRGAGVANRADAGPLLGSIGNVNRASTFEAKDFCMFSALRNGLEGEIFVDDVDTNDGCDDYRCSVVDMSGARHYYTISDCGVGLNTEGW